MRQKVIKMTFSSVWDKIKKGFFKLMEPKVFLNVGAVYFGLISIMLNFSDGVYVLEELRINLAFYIFLVGSVVIDYLQKPKES